jgi:hypothetical protein
LTIARIAGTDIFHAAALLWVAGLGHLAQGNVDLHAMAWLLLGSIRDRGRRRARSRCVRRLAAPTIAAQ